MNIKKNNGFIGVDMGIAVIAILAFSGLIISLMYNNYLENARVKMEAMSTIYLTEILENIGISNYSNVTQEKAKDLIPTNIKNSSYNAEITVNSNSNTDSNLNLSETQNEDIIKKVKVTLSYTIANKKYQHTMERIKIKE